MPTRRAPGVDPTAHRRPPRGPGRPARTSIDRLAAAAIELGLDSFTLAAVAEHVGVAESTVYNYVAGRDQLYAVASARVFAELDLETDADGWVDHIDTVAQRTFELARQHPGLGEYVLGGPYEPSTLAIFDTLVTTVRGWLPDLSDHLAYVVTSRPFVLTLAYLGDPTLEPLAPWVRRALLQGLDAMVAEGGPLPPDPPETWRSKLGFGG